MSKCASHKIDSNIVGLRYAKETCPGILPSDPTWTQIEFNENKSFSPELKTESRSPISESRQNQIGGVVDIDSKVGFVQDLTMDNTTDLMQGFIFAAAREKATTKSLNKAKIALTVDSGKAKLASAAPFAVGDIVLLSEFRTVPNNGITTITAIEDLDTTLTFEKVLQDELGTAGAVTTVGKHLTGAAIEIVSGQASLTGTDLDKLGLIHGEWIFVGGINTASSFTNNRGFARIYNITPTQIMFDKCWDNPVAEAAKDVDIFLGTVIKNEEDPDLVITQSYQFERTLGKSNGKIQAEYNKGSVANEITMTVPSAGKVTVELGYVSIGNEVRTAEQGLKDGTRPRLTTAKDFINTSTDFARINMSVLDNLYIIPESQLFTYATDMSIKINNGVEPVKAIGHMGGIDTTIANFTVSGSITAYFTSVEVIDALINAHRLTFDTIMSRDNKAIIFDMPLLVLTGGELNIESNKPITIPLDMNAAESYNGYTLMYMQFPFVPEI